MSRNGGNDMQKHLISAVGILILALLGGCDKAKSPQTVANDVSADQQKAVKDVADAKKEASQEMSTAQAKVDEKAKDLNNVAAQAAYNVTVAKADGNHKIALDKCAAVGGDAQAKCKDQADADYEAAKADAKATEVSQTK
jgi:hypothetical protein